MGDTEVTTYGSRRIVVTAPHCIPLCRDGHPTHKREEWTRVLALRIAKTMRGSALTWSKQVWEELGSKPDPAHRDPNYLRADELESNAWSQQLGRMVEGAPAFHVDLHGARDPSEASGHSAHVHLGLMAMKRSPCPRVHHACEVLRSALAAELAQWAYELCDGSISGVCGDGQAADGSPLLRGYPVVEPNPQRRLTGALDPEGGRLTMTQQSVRFGCSHSVQIELSKTVREILARKDSKGCRQLRNSFAMALFRAWERANAMPEPASPRAQPAPTGAGPRTPTRTPRRAESGKRSGLGDARSRRHLSPASPRVAASPRAVASPRAAAAKARMKARMVR